MADLAVVVVVLLIIGAAVIYIRKEKKNGVKCIGCPAGATCGKAQCCGCSGSDEGHGCSCHSDDK